MSPDKTDIIDRLKGACNGKPANIEWPHRLLHDAIAEIERLIERLDAMEKRVDEGAGIVEALTEERDRALRKIERLEKAYEASSAERTDLYARVVALEKERDDADRRAGAAERKYEALHKTFTARSNHLAAYMEERGYDTTTSFDVVWAETCAKADRVNQLTEDGNRLIEVNARQREQLAKLVDALRSYVAEETPRDIGGSVGRRALEETGYL